ncbi:MAG: transcriptional repressor LexA [Sedimentisphaerales bacterium]
MGQKTDVPPTPRQVQLLKTIAEFAGRDGYSPTIGELAQTAGVSRTTTFEHIEQLRKKGLVSGPAGKARSLTPTSKARKLLKRLAVAETATAAAVPAAAKQGEIPLAGVVAAGLPIEAVENKDNLSINSLFGSCDEVFALEVRGDSMAGENINDGDYVICRRASSASDGQLVVAIVDNENATLKRFYREPPASPLATPWQGGRVRLQPANDEYQPIYSDNCRVEGVVIGLIRKL